MESIRKKVNDYGLKPVARTEAVEWVGEIEKQELVRIAEAEEREWVADIDTAQIAVGVINQKSDRSQIYIEKGRVQPTKQESPSGEIKR